MATELKKFVPWEIAVDSLAQITNRLLQLLLQLADLVVGGIVIIELWLRGQLGQLGVPQNIQSVVLVVLAVLLIVGALRLFGGLIRVGVILVLVLIGLHIVMPLVQH